MKVLHNVSTSNDKITRLGMAKNCTQHKYIRPKSNLDYYNHFN